jgi:hypothetical protein
MRLHPPGVAPDLIEIATRQSRLGNQGPDRFDRHEHHVLAERGTDEPVAFIEFSGSFVDCVGDHGSHSGNLGGRKASSQGVRQ